MSPRLTEDDVTTLGLCDACQGEGRIYYYAGHCRETGGEFWQGRECPCCCGLGGVPVLAGWESDDAEAA